MSLNVCTKSEGAAQGLWAYNTSDSLNANTSASIGFVIMHAFAWKIVTQQVMLYVATIVIINGRKRTSPTDIAES